MFENEFLHDESVENPPPPASILTVLGWFQMLYGFQEGQAMYTALMNTAKAAAVYDDLGGRPGILFNDDGGEFVSLDDPTI